MLAAGDVDAQCVVLGARRGAGRDKVDIKRRVVPAHVARVDSDLRGVVPSALVNAPTNLVALVGNSLEGELVVIVEPIIALRVVASCAVLIDIAMSAHIERQLVVSGNSFLLEHSRNLDVIVGHGDFQRGILLLAAGKLDAIRSPLDKLVTLLGNSLYSNLFLLFEAEVNGFLLVLTILDKTHRVIFRGNRQRMFCFRLRLGVDRKLDKQLAVILEVCRKRERFAFYRRTFVQRPLDRIRFVVCTSCQRNASIELFLSKGNCRRDVKRFAIAQDFGVLNIACPHADSQINIRRGFGIGSGFGFSAGILLAKGNLDRFAIHIGRQAEAIVCLRLIQLRVVDHHVRDVAGLGTHNDIRVVDFRKREAILSAFQCFISDRGCSALANIKGNFYLIAGKGHDCEHTHKHGEHQDDTQ